MKDNQKNLSDKDIVISKVPLPSYNLPFPVLLAGLTSLLVIIIVSVTIYVMPKADATIKVSVDPSPVGNSVATVDE